MCSDIFHFITCLGNDMNRERQTYSADESFMSNLELQKVAQESENEPQEMEDDLPSASDVLHHIRRISSGKKTLRLIQHMNVTPPVKPAALIDDIPDTESIVDQVKIELVKYNVSQEVFAKAVLGKSQGYLSEMLKHGENMFSPSEQTHCRGWQNFETMRQFMTKPEAERLRIYFQKGEELKMERLKRRQMETVSCYKYVCIKDSSLWNYLMNMIIWKLLFVFFFRLT